VTQKSAATLSLDQFVAAPAEQVWRTLTEPDLLARWWVAGDIAAVVGHRFQLHMPQPWGAVGCEVLEVVPPERLVYRFTQDWTLTWRLIPEGTGTRLFLDQSGFDLDDSLGRQAFERMGAGWERHILPKLADLAASLDR
jgi:uncharacterized protein YndB with AHSA1/START domain